jgi:hypothetical protein
MSDSGGAQKVEAVLRDGPLEVRISSEDAKHMRVALLDALRRSRLGDRDQLLALTEPLPAWIDSDGRVMLGGWMLSMRKGVLVASYRLNQDAERAVGYAAELGKQDGQWRIVRISPEITRFRS